MSVTQLVDAAGLASLLGISTRTLARMVKSGEIPRPVEMGRLRRWNPTDVDEALRRKSKREGTR
jgi:excisionase family DNA binding protein